MKRIANDIVSANQIAKSLNFNVSNADTMARQIQDAGGWQWSAAVREDGHRMVLTIAASANRNDIHPWLKAPITEIEVALVDDAGNVAMFLAQAPGTISEGLLRSGGQIGLAPTLFKSGVHILAGNLNETLNASVA